MFLEHTPTKKEIIETHEKIKGYIHHTPVLTSKTLNKMLKCELFFKCENFQKTGSFKLRGAVNAISSLSDEELKNGVATHSSGNHAAAVALSAKVRNAKAYIVMPRTAPEIKKKAVAGYGAEIIFCEPTLKAREVSLKNITDKTGAVFIPSYNNYSIIAGQATAAKELIESTNKLDYILSPIGGGGLSSGTALSANYFSPDTKVIACEPTGADDAFRSIKTGKIIPMINPVTIADGLLTSLGDKTFPIIQQYVEKIVTVDDESIIKSMRLIWERMKIIIEPSSAVVLAAAFNRNELFTGKRVGLILSGGNVDLDNLPWQIDN